MPIDPRHPDDKRDTIRDFLDTQESVLMNCYFMIKDISFLSDVTNSKEIKEVIAGDRMFIRVGNIEWSQLIMELFHLYEPTENYSLNRLLNFSIRNFEMISWEMPDLKKLKEVGKLLRDKPTIKRADRVIYIRHKIKAHLDPARFNKEVLIYIDDAKVLYNTAETIVGEVYYQLNAIRTTFDFSFLGEIETTITRLSTYHDRLKDNYDANGQPIKRPDL